MHDYKVEGARPCSNQPSGYLESHRGFFSNVSRGQKKKKNVLGYNYWSKERNCFQKPVVSPWSLVSLKKDRSQGEGVSNASQQYHVSAQFRLTGFAQHVMFFFPLTRWLGLPLFLRWRRRKPRFFFHPFSKEGFPALHLAQGHSQQSLTNMFPTCTEKKKFLNENKAKRKRFYDDESGGRYAIRAQQLHA